MLKRNIVFILAMALMTISCGGKSSSKKKWAGQTIRIISGSENESLMPVIKDFSRKTGLNVEMIYKGSVDIMMALEEETVEYDAVWPANSMWISMGDHKRRVKHTTSIMSSPVVIGIRKSKANELGFIGKKVKISDILEAVINKKLTFMMTSASQSNSGASAYFGFLYAIAKNPEVLTEEHLKSPELRSSITKLLGGINRSSGSSGWLKKLFLKGNYDAMVNYEAMIIETNQSLVAEGKEPLYVIYPVDGTVLADSPLGFLNTGSNKAKEVAFEDFQKYLLSDEVQEKINKLGRRTGIGGLSENADMKIFNPDWGIDAKKILSPIKMPSPQVISSALLLYQTEFRKPSYTVFCLDFSGSMMGRGEAQLKEAMSLILDINKAKKYMIQNGSRDMITVIAFSDRILKIWNATGANPQSIKDLENEIKNFKTSGSTDIYSPVVKGIEILKERTDLQDFVPAIILMTDGHSNMGRRYVDLADYYKKAGLDIPVFSIMFGSASPRQLKEIETLTLGKVFDGKKNLAEAFRKAKGYN